MKSLTEHLWFEVPNRVGSVNITEIVANLVRKSGVQEEICLVNAMHITDDTGVTETVFTSVKLRPSVAQRNESG